MGHTSLVRDMRSCEAKGAFVSRCCTCMAQQLHESLHIAYKVDADPSLGFSDSYGVHCDLMLPLQRIVECV